MSQRDLKKIDYILLGLLPPVAALVALALHANYLTSTLLFFGIASLWFSYRAPKKILKTALFSLVLVPFWVMLDYVLVADFAWWSPTIFASRLLGILPYEDFIWGFFQIYLIVILYEYFLDKGRDRTVGRYLRYFLYPLGVLLVFFAYAYYFMPAAVHIPYAYFWSGLLFGLIPSALFLYRFPRELHKFLVLSLYFFYLHVTFEFTALSLGNWVFNGNDYIWTVVLAGFRIPIEEIVVWWVFFVITVLSWYEFFDDDRK